MFIDDDELRGLYQAASEDHLNTIEASLLHLEKNPLDKAPLTTLLRAMHSLKGDSRMLGVQDGETLMHQMEDLLAPVDQGTQTLTTDLCDRIYIGLDAMRRIAREATTGESAHVSMFHLMAQLMGAKTDAEPRPTRDVIASVSRPEPATTGTDESQPRSDTQTQFIPPETAPTENPVTTADVENQSGIDTIRVKAQTLDGLMMHADELAIAKLQVTQRMEDLAGLVNFWEDWNRDLAKLKHQSQTVAAEAFQDFETLNRQRLQDLGNLLAQVRSRSTEDTARLDSVTQELESGLRNLRLMPLASVFSVFPRMVRDIGKQQQKDIRFEVEGGETLADKRILEDIKDPLTHLLRNAIDHGIESVSERLENGKSATASIRLRSYSLGDRIAIEVLDDGRGLDIQAIRRTAARRGLYTEAELAGMSEAQIQGLIFAPGFSTRNTVTELSGRGVGLDVVRNNIERLKGSIEVESTPNKGCTFRLFVSSNLANIQALLARVNQNVYAIPLDAIKTMLLVSRQDVFTLEGRPTLIWQDQPIPVAWLSNLLELPGSSQTSSANTALTCVILTVGKTYLGVIVDALLEQQTLVLKPQSKLLQRVRNVTGAALLGSGEICMVLNPNDLVRSALKGNDSSAIAQLTAVSTKTKVLLVEDSIPIRTQVKRILEGAGYDVTAAVDGLDGFNKLRNGQFEAVVSDVEMPNLTGLELTSRIRQYSEYEELPIILVTTLAKDEDKRRGADAGANAYLTKGDFDQSLLLNTLRRLV
jgi:two-component system, chemotaxis family, sensor kinase CheA